MSYVEKTVSYAHQLAARDKARGRAGFGYLMEMGTGKTKVAIDELGEALEERHVEQALILAPNGVYSNWTQNEIPAHMPDHIVDRTRIHLWDGGNTVREKKAINELINETDRHGIMCMNLEAIGSSDKAWTIAREFVKRRRTSIIVDESTRIKNPTALVTKTLTNPDNRENTLGALSPMRRILTGYPNPNGPMDLFSQMDFCVPGALGANFYSFRHKYAITKEMQVGWKQNARGQLVPKMTKLIVGYQRQEELSERLLRNSYRALKRDCLDLPPENYHTRKVAMTNEQNKVYKDLVNQCTSELAGLGAVTATMIITQLLRLHQVACGFVTLDDGREVPIKNNRLRHMQEWSEELSGRPGIVWCTYQHNIREVSKTLRDMYGENRVVEYHGEIDRRNSDIARDRFQGGDADWFVATEQKGGFGITLTRSADDLFYSNTYNLEQRLQAEARTHRSGQTSSVNHGDLICEGTVDEKIVRRLRDKMDVGDAILQDGWRKWVI